MLLWKKSPENCFNNFQTNNLLICNYTYKNVRCNTGNDFINISDIISLHYLDLRIRAKP